ncbi:NAD(P)/FAD-dependent oxidoreductase [Planococcus shenhongbingii]|uniref:phytoene desaturase family protein n=1 Tax=Planococcus shenhongbingii TaxID=3058398 RepID=UPI002629232B|nr:NAD(P)/FAD-dependent oxidoreductase [Planococcus sp. N016]WKA59484.1 NAD(P)/FAD-dependent oxidoreductase [Planococcus sp. N016]
MNQDVLVVGAGFGGLTAASLLSKHGMSVTLLEASSELGGCAGKFTRHKFVFPVGATLGMGLEENGILERVFRYLEKPFPLEPLETVMEMIHPEATFLFLRDRNRHVEQLILAFPQYKKQIQSFYSEVFSTASIIRTLMGPLPVLPPSTAKEWTFLIGSLRPRHIKLLPFFNQTLEHRLERHGLAHLTLFRQMIDGLLMDSMQTDSKNAMYLLSALALDIYHEGAYYVPGGLYRFAELMGQSLTENGGTLKKRRTLVNLQHADGKWMATDHRGTQYKAAHVVLNVPIHQLPKILPANSLEQLKKPLRDGLSTPTWTTLALYIAVDSSKLGTPLPLFRQIATEAGAGLAEGAHFFMSASRPGDLLRAPLGIQTVTISTHSQVQHWDTQEKYESTREAVADRILHSIEKVVPNFKEAIIHFETGAPKAWERFAGRPNGYVGGFPQTLDNALFNAISHRSGLPGLYVCGDHIFPGGGTIGVATSGIHAARSITGERLIL